MNTLRAESKSPAAADEPRERRSAQQEGRVAQDRNLPRTRPSESPEPETYNLPFTD